MLVLDLQALINKQSMLPLVLSVNSFVEYSPWEADSELGIKAMCSILRSPNECYLFLMSKLPENF
jgi:hypothetical protein